MKHNILKTFLLLLCLLTGIGTMWAETKTVSITASNSGITASYTDNTFTISGVTFGYTQWLKNTNIQAKKSTVNSCYNITAMPGVIKKITVIQTGTARAITMYGGTAAQPTTALTSPTTAATMVFDFSGKNYTYFSMKTPANAVYMDKITIEYEATVAVTGISLNKSTLNLNVGQTSTLTATVLPSNATDKTVEWFSTNNKVATVANGVVTAVAAGTANITAKTTDGGFKAMCAVTVKEEAPKTYANTYTSADGLLTTTEGTSTSAVKVIIGGTEFDAIKAGTSSVAGAVKVTVPANTKTLHFHVAGWNNEGKAITVSGLSAEQKITITPDAGVANSSPFTLQGNAETDHYYTITTNNSTALTLTLTATTGKRFVLFGVNAEMGAEVVAVTSVSLNKSTLELTEGQTGTLTATVLPSNASDKTIEWSSANAKVATVSNGVVTAVGAGTVTISAISISDRTKKAQCTVTVKASGTPTTPTTPDTPSTDGFLKTSTLTIEKDADPYDVRKCLNLPSDYGTTDYAITTSISGLCEKDGEFACAYCWIAFQKAGTYKVTVKAAATSKYAASTGTITVTVPGATTQTKTLQSIAVSGTPATFHVGDAFSHTGMTVTASYSDGSKTDVTASAQFSGYNMSKAGAQNVTVSYTESGVTKTTTYSIRVLGNLTPAPDWCETVNFTTVEPYKSLTDNTSIDMEEYVGSSFQMAFAKSAASTYAPRYYKSDKSVRAYAGNTLLITAAENITYVTLDWLTGYADNAATVQGLGTKNVTITFSRSCRFNAASVYYRERKIGYTIGSYYYDTFSSDVPVEFAGTTVCTVKVTVDNLVELTPVANSQVPANTGVMIISTRSAAPYKKIASAEALTDNLLYPASKNMTELPNSYFYKLAYGSNTKENLGFYWGAENGGAFTPAAGTAYLAITYHVEETETEEEGEVAPPTLRFKANAVETAIDTPKASVVGRSEAYNLNGQRVKANAKGIVIVNGRKIINK